MGRLTNEPTLVVELVRAALLCAVVFGLPLSEEQTAAVLLVVSAALAVVNRQRVAPVSGVR